MLVLYETPAGYALFQIKDDSKVTDVEDITQHFSDADSANKLYATNRGFRKKCYCVTYLASGLSSRPSENSAIPLKRSLLQHPCWKAH